jgi:hypothetical protein
MQYQLVLQNRRVPASALAAVAALLAALALLVGYWLGSVSATIAGGAAPSAAAPVVASQASDPNEGSQPSPCGTDCGDPAVAEPGP